MPVSPNECQNASASPAQRQAQRKSKTDSPDGQRRAAERHLDFRIDGVMRFEKLKARLQIDPVRMAERAVEHLARLRYPAR